MTQGVLLMLMCGTSFSGKSTVARSLAPGVAATLVSLDEINERRGLWGGDGIPIEEWIRTHEIASTEVHALLCSGTSVVVDDTSSPRFLRDRWRSVAADSDAGFVLVHLDVGHDTIRRRHAENRITPGRRDVADAVLEQHLAEFEPPQPDENAVRVKSAEDLPDWLLTS